MMSLRDDYPAITILADAVSHLEGGPEAVRMYRELGRLRDELERVKAERDVWMNAVADAVEPLGYDRHAASGPADLLPGLTTLTERAYSCCWDIRP